MTQIVPLTYAPDADTAWFSNQGALAAISNFAPLARGSYGTVGSWSDFTVTGTDYLYARIFRKVDGTVRFLVFRAGDIDEYITVGTRTNRKTGATTSTGWCAAAFGDAIIATNNIDKPYVSTGAGFTDLAGTPPQAKLIAANQNFVMLADYINGSDDFSDGWWCSALGNPTGASSWTPSLATQCANGRLLDVPGPIKALVSYKDTFLAFKDNAIIILEYVYSGASTVVWAARTVHNAVGTHGPHSVAVLNGIVYFVHSSGFYAFDGTNVVSIGDGVEATFLELLGEIDRNNGPTQAMADAATLADVQAIVDDVENIVWFFFSTLTDPDEPGDNVCKTYGFGYNAVSRKWGRIESPAYAFRPVPVVATHSEIKAFAATYNRLSRVLFLKTPTTVTKLYAYAYPNATTTTSETHGAGTLQTGVIGEHGKTIRSARVHWHTSYDAECVNASQVATIAAYGYKNSAKTFASGNVTGSVNTTLDCGDVQLAAPFLDIRLTTPTNIACEFHGIGVEVKQQGAQ
jgi:hypothetical protein